MDGVTPTIRNVLTKKRVPHIGHPFLFCNILIFQDDFIQLFFVNKPKGAGIPIIFNRDKAYGLSVCTHLFEVEFLGVLLAYSNNALP
ncbi:hypothetical protein SRABI36_04232 [Pedobacter sp. Bi36]|nr:hypothetical protein SRABI126_01021 [Pedobacter sp. Bi126]CAH0288410.1 hypothetical protein SRABI36_04232 [Pedobacter sp. Bi36]